MYKYLYYYAQVQKGWWYLCELNLTTKKIRLLEVRN